jgi:hypothetical protein
MKLLKIRILILAAPLVLGLEVLQSNAGEFNTFIVAAASGYGVEDCLGEGGECGRVVADAWCEAHDRGVALKFGQSVSDEDGSSTNPRHYFITCGD